MLKIIQSKQPIRGLYGVKIKNVACRGARFKLIASTIFDKQLSASVSHGKIEARIDPFEKVKMAYCTYQFEENNEEARELKREKVSLAASGIILLCFQSECSLSYKNKFKLFHACEISANLFSVK